MIDFGKDLKAAREAKGLTISNIAEMTHMMSAMVEDMENENFSRIVAPIYGRGFVKLYCEAVGLDAKPYIAEFMEIYNGNRDPAIRERKSVTAVADIPSTAADAPAEEPLPTSGDPSDLFSSPSVQSDYYSEHLFATEEPAEEEPVPSPRTKPLPKFTPYSAPLQERIRSKIINIDPKLIRVSFLGIVSLIILWILFLGIRGLYRATTSAPNVSAAQTVETSESAATVETSSAESAKRVPMEIPPLYID